MGSKWADYAYGEIREAFPEAKAGVWNCRKISGSSAWSQHSWGNALDLRHEDTGYSTGAKNQAFLDDVHRWIKTYQWELSVRVLLWRVRDHFDHIHMDGWPKGYGTPPCAGGSLRMQYNSGTVVNGDPGPVNGTIELPDKELIAVGDAQVLEKGNSGHAVADLQKWLVELGYDLGDWTPYGPGYPPGADGEYGGTTLSGVEEYQAQRDLIVSGKADGVTLHFIRADLGYAGQGELVPHTHDVKIVVPGQTVKATTEAGEV